ncbi:MAG: aconitate hydratase AcnA [Phycisphaerales bacterium]|nr:aconitate hydratase AcnA [Phycisphaerales bacterium]
MPSSPALKDVFAARADLKTAAGSVAIYRLDALAKRGIGHVDRLPFSIKVLLESIIRTIDGVAVQAADAERLAKWNAKNPGDGEIPFMPARVVLQDFTGVPAIVDLAAMRDAMAALGGDPKRINPQLPVDLVIDHSVQVDSFGALDSLRINTEMEFERNLQRYEFLRWGQNAFANFRVIPPATGIVHQINLEYLADAVFRKTIDGKTVAMPDTLVGTDSHTTMINGLGVVGWGVGGIEAEAVMLGQPLYMVMPEVVGFRLTGALPEGATATDLVLTITEMLRKHGVVGKFVEFYGPGLSTMRLADRATIGNMAPEYGATIGFFPIDAETLRYLKQTARPDDLIDLVERYSKEQGLFRTDATPDPSFSSTLELNLAGIEPSLAGPKRPQDRVRMADLKTSFRKALSAPVANRGFGLTETDLARTGELHNGKSVTLRHGSVAIAAITSCTNTSNPSVMIGAGLLAKKAVEKGLTVKPYVKTSLAPGSRVVTDYLDHAGLTPFLEKLGFHTVAYGCTTCIGNSGPLPEHVRAVVKDKDLVVASVLSGNRNFEGRISPDVKANYLASPPLVVAFAIAGTTEIDLSTEPLGTGKDGKPVYLKDVWPTQREISEAMDRCVTPDKFKKQYDGVETGNAKWNAVPVPTGDTYRWDDANTYIQNPPFFTDMPAEPRPIAAIRGARVLLMLGDSITTDHISPAGSVKTDSPAGKYLQERGVAPKDFNSYGARRGNDRVMTRGTFANVRLRNLLAPGSEGCVTTHLPTGERTSVYDAAMKYKSAGTPLVVLAGTEYGTGSSRDWAAKGTMLLGVRAVLAVSFERIHRSNLVGMGVLPLQFKNGQTRETLGLTGQETYDIAIDDRVKPQQDITVTAVAPDGQRKTITATARLDTAIDVDYYRHGGILPMVIRNLAKG